LDQSFHTDKSYAIELGQKDPLASFRDQFVIDDPDLIYMDGNSLGRLPQIVSERVNSIVKDEWGKNLIRSWNQGWWDAPTRIGEKIAALIGASPGQVIVCDSVSVNLFKLTMAALSLKPDRSKIITDCLNFPSDLYILQGCVELLGNKHKIIRIGSLDGEITPDLESLYNEIDQDTALVTLSHVVFKSGFLYDMAAITQKACEVDFALGCTYKYLNGGPGSPAFIYANKNLNKSYTSPIWGWWGSKDPFNFAIDYSPTPGVQRFLSGSQPMITMLGLETALEPLLQAGMIPLREKSIKMCDYFIKLSDIILAPLGFSLGSPRNPSIRGSHISLRHPEGYRINRVLIDDLNVIPDFREPDNIRYGIAPIYTSYSDIWEAVERSRKAVADKLYDRIPPTRLKVT
jgi:kynureninase